MARFRDEGTLREGMEWREMGENQEITPNNIINPPKGTYAMKASCSNCHYEWTIEITKGHSTHMIEITTKCFNCECEGTIHLRPLHYY